MSAERGITAEQFEREYAERSKITVERLRKMGRIVAPCDCGETECRGWQSVNGKDYEADKKERGL